MEFVVERGEVGDEFTLVVREQASPSSIDTSFSPPIYSKYYCLTISRKVLTQINEELLFEFKNEIELFDVLQFNYNERDKFPSITFSCLFFIFYLIFLLIQYKYLIY